MLTPNANLKIANVSFFDYQYKVWTTMRWTILVYGQPEWSSLGEKAYWSLKAETLSPLTNLPVLVELMVEFVSNESSEDFEKRIKDARWGEKVNVMHMDEIANSQKKRRDAEFLESLRKESV